MTFGPPRERFLMAIRRFSAGLVLGLALVAVVFALAA